MSNTIYLNSTFGYREDTLKNWQTANPVLVKGEISFVRDGENGKFVKIGDGHTKWNSLPFAPLPKGEQGDRGEKGDKGDSAVTDQTYSPTSENAQSGKAVAEAIASVGGSGGTWETIADITLDETNGDVNSLSVQIPKETVDIVKQCTELMCFVEFTAKNNYSASKIYLSGQLTGLNLPVLYATNGTLAKDKQARVLARTILSDIGNLVSAAQITQNNLFNSANTTNNYTCQSFTNIKDKTDPVALNVNLSFSSSQTEQQTFGVGTHIKLIGRKA